MNVFPLEPVAMQHPSSYGAVPPDVRRVSNFHGDICPNFEDKVKAGSNQGQSNEIASSSQGKGRVRASTGKVKAGSRRGQGKVKERFWQGKILVEERFSLGHTFHI